MVRHKAIELASGGGDNNVADKISGKSSSVAEAGVGLQLQGPLGWVLRLSVRQEVLWDSLLPG